MKLMRLLGVACLVSLAYCASAQPAPAVDPTILKSIGQKAEANWNDQDYHDFKVIFNSVADGSKDVTPADRKRFWAIMDKMSATPQEMSYFLRTTISGCQYRTDFMRDALVAYERHTQYLSPERAADEAFLLAQAQATGTAGQQRKQIAFRRNSVAADDDLIAKIAARKPVFLADAGETVIFDEKRIKKTQIGMEIIRQRLLLLLKRP